MMHPCHVPFERPTSARQVQHSNAINACFVAPAAHLTCSRRTEACSRRLPGVVWATRTSRLLGRRRSVARCPPRADVGGA